MPLTTVVTDGSALILTWTLSTCIERTWDLLTEPKRVSTWLGDIIDGEIAAGSSFVIDHGDDVLCRSTVIEFARPRVLRSTWEFPDEPPSVVEWSLVATDGGTTLTLAHTLTSDVVDSYRIGWPVHLTYLEAASLGEPLPPAMFWNFHATMTKLAENRKGALRHK